MDPAEPPAARRPVVIGHPPERGRFLPVAALLQHPDDDFAALVPTPASSLPAFGMRPASTRFAVAPPLLAAAVDHHQTSFLRTALRCVVHRLLHPALHRPPEALAVRVCMSPCETHTLADTVSMEHSS